MSSVSLGLGCTCKALALIGGPFVQYYARKYKNEANENDTHQREFCHNRCFCRAEVPVHTLRFPSRILTSIIFLSPSVLPASAEATTARAASAALQSPPAAWARFGWVQSSSKKNKTKNRGWKWEWSAQFRQRVRLRSEKQSRK